MKFYVCNKCGNIIVFLKDVGVPVMCCGKKMEELVPGASNASSEKHVPVVQIDGEKVTVDVGSVKHPMLKEHSIEWVVLETENGFKKVDLCPDQEPKAEFTLVQGEKVITAYAYCNQHGLWKAE